MKTPSLLARIAGIPVVALAILAGCGAVILKTYHGEFPWWAAFGGVVISLRTLGAVVQVYRYKKLMTAWQAMGTKPGTQETKKSPSRRWWPFVALALAVALPVLPIKSDTPAGKIVPVIWFVACLYLAVVAIRFLLRAYSKRRVIKRGQVKEKADAAPVTWLLGRASSSPGREEATAKLPGYCAQILKANNVKKAAS